MTKTIDYGIDLGTTNSAIARVSGDEVRVFKNRDQKDVTPSAIHIARMGRMIVGQKAYNQLFEDPENVAVEFKRIMGQSDRRTFMASGQTRSAEELSAEVLRSLVDDANRQTGLVCDAAVITVPAAFGQLQCEATARAAALAGLSTAPLLQEPLAASIAYGIRPGSHEKRWLVYDLGGGTFDIAIISTRDGQLSVLEHRGNNMLGGKDIDRLIVRNLVWPRLCEAFRLADAPPSSGRMAQILHKRAEEAKIDLSYSPVTIITVTDVGEDAHGREIESEIEITRSDLTGLVEELLSGTVDLCEEAIRGARLSTTDISEILLVGGPTYMPVLREMLTDRLGVPLNFSIDPMTVVAQGAAVFGSTMLLDVPRTQVAVPHSNSVVVLDLAYEPVWPDLTTLVAGRLFEPHASQSIQIQIASASSIWQSGWVPVQDGYFEIEVHLRQGKSEGFRIEARNHAGLPLSTEPAEFSIRHGLTIGEIPLPHSVGAEIVDKSGKPTIDVIFPRSTPLPAETIRTYQASKTLRPSTPDDYIAVKIWEGEHFEDPESNTWVGALKISARDLRRPIPEGAEISVSLSINQSRLLHVEAYVPFLDQTFREGVYIPKENEQAQVDRMRNLTERLPAIYDRLDEVERIADEYSDDEASGAVSSLRTQVENLDIEQQRHVSFFGDDPDEAKRIVERERQLRGELSALEAKLSAEHSLAVLVRDARESSVAAARVTEQWGELADRKEYEYLAADLEKYASGHSERALRKLTEDLDALRYRVLFRQNWFWRQIFEDLAEPGRVRDVEETRHLISEGWMVISQGDDERMRSVVVELFSYLIDSEANSALSRRLAAGIRKSSG